MEASKYLSESVRVWSQMILLISKSLGRHLTLEKNIILGVWEMLFTKSHPFSYLVFSFPWSCNGSLLGLGWKALFYPKLIESQWLSQWLVEQHLLGNMCAWKFTENTPINCLKFITIWNIWMLILNLFHYVALQISFPMDYTCHSILQLINYSSYLGYVCWSFFPLIY